MQVPKGLPSRRPITAAVISSSLTPGTPSIETNVFRSGASSSGAVVVVVVVVVSSPEPSPSPSSAGTVVVVVVLCYASVVVSSSSPLLLQAVASSERARSTATMPLSGRCIFPPKEVIEPDAVTHLTLVVERR